MLRTQVEDALAELVALGLVHCDSFAGLRALLTPSDRRKPLGGWQETPAHRALRHRGCRTLGARPASGAIAAAAARRTGRTTKSSTTSPIRLLRRYGVVFWRLLEREAAWLPPWRELLRVLRRLEARGEIRGGRFVAGISGEQFALPEAVDLHARDAARARITGLDLVERGRSAEPHRQHRSGSEGSRGHQQPRAVSQRHPGRSARSPARPSGSRSSSRESAPTPRAPRQAADGIAAARVLALASRASVGAYASLTQALPLAPAAARFELRL